MRGFKNLKTQSKLLILFAAITLVGAVTTGWSMLNILDLQEKIHQIQQEAEELSHTAMAQAYLLEQGIASESFLLTGAPRDQSQLERYNEQIEQYLRRALTDAESVDKIMIYKRVLALQGLVEQANSQVKATVIIGGISLVLLSGLVIVASIGTNQVAEPMLHLTNAVVAFESGVFEPELLKGYLRRRDEMGQLVRAFNAMARSITESVRAKDQLLNAATRFVPHQFLDFLEKENIVQIRLGDHVSAEMAVMFSDIRGFTSMSESMSPQENFDFVNAYLKLVSPVIQENNGFIVKFLGDGMMAIFPYGVDDALKAGIEKQQKVRLFNAELQKQGLPPIRVGVGIHTGHMMVGMIGEEMRIQGDAFSDNVNLTSRVEGLTEFYGVSMIISQETRMRLEQPDRYHMRYLGKAQVKGRERPISLYDVFEGDPEEVKALKQQTQADYKRGLKLYMSGKFAEARACFESVLQRYPEDKTAALYLERSTAMMGQPVPEDWEGVEVMTSK